MKAWRPCQKSSIFLYVLHQLQRSPLWPPMTTDKDFVSKLSAQAFDVNLLRQFFGECAYVAGILGETGRVVISRDAFQSLNFAQSQTRSEVPYRPRCLATFCGNIRARMDGSRSLTRADREPGGLAVPLGRKISSQVHREDYGALSRRWRSNGAPPRRRDTCEQSRLG